MSCLYTSNDDANDDNNVKIPANSDKQGLRGMLTKYTSGRDTCQVVTNNGKVTKNGTPLFYWLYGYYGVDDDNNVNDITEYAKWQGVTIYVTF